MARARSTKGRELLAALSEAQRAAVVDIDGPVLILAGAGSGKTRVLTYRIAYMIASGKVEPQQILAVTFTNKAAGEMRQRVDQLVPGVARQIVVSTFHSAFARILRREGGRIGLSANFSIYDEEDQKRLVKECIEELGLPQARYNPAVVAALISRAKSAVLLPDDYAQAAESEFDFGVAQVYKRYQQRLREANAADFDDLLLLPIMLFRSHPPLLHAYQERLRYILVDEYQDTNRAQYELLKLLSSRYRNLCVVGDDDQSIYRWRGADLRNILEFEKDFPDCKVYWLEQNYRSTKCILAAASSVIAHNRARKPKVLWTDGAVGEKVTVVEAPTDADEAYAVITRIEREFQHGTRNFRDFAVLYRTNAQSRVLEEALRRSGIPYVIVGGVRFYERKEIKDLLAYLRVICNPADTMNLLRIINTPPRGIGEATIARLQAFSTRVGVPLFEALRRAREVEGLSPTMQERVTHVHRLIQKHVDLRSQVSAAELASALVDELGILRIYKEEGTEEALNRADNVRELLDGIADYCRQNPGATLDDYLQEVSLLTDIDTWNDRSNAVSLMTVHAAKGLEFPVVFITGLEEGLFPLSRSFDSTEDLEEERRLFYVGSTRAKEKLYLTWASTRLRQGQTYSCLPSRFLEEIDHEQVDYEVAGRVGRRASYQAPARRGEGERRSVIRRLRAYEEESQLPAQLEIGCRVRHPKFGPGTVLAVSRASVGTTLTIDFDRYGRKKIVLEFAQLQVL
ncbi:MAG: UvrD-helicase domain-containing protein [candidate division KSB1 bacterium]|nr:UvrD-helicase domain-containing protein [candidate division KSB1 bacterium]MDZ7295115.1 UvrD-helicase domain-containing protein [candidate division KSB1 bacterium]MDZ7385020.1 UvrD-helicase domain-containing protein [candidate division KSB1 bacterium]MDZ7391695.1 UvrD-helicase domain-containing protein [candidate division KSB1 bacterium]MDZ7413516.1 UvrD-helicase domain-containing protein [candidate division KSB1 bacterium]